MQIARGLALLLFVAACHAPAEVSRAARMAPLPALRDRPTAAPDTNAVSAPPPELRARLRLSPWYAKHLDAGGIPVLGSADVNDFALREAAFLVDRMIGHRPDVRAAIAARGIRIVVMSKHEMTTDVPEHADLTPKAYWDRRARGLGATRARPATSAGEENLLGLPGDPYSTENIFVHELAHTIHEHGMSVVDSTFDARLETAFAHARARGLWAGTYAATNRAEYWAEATQSWFDTNRANDSEHGPIDTRDRLVPYDPEVASLLREAYGDGAWRYGRPDRRPASARAHLAGFDPRAAGVFAWPSSGRAEAWWKGTTQDSSWRRPSELPSRSPSGDAQPATVVFVNRRVAEVHVDWIDFGGARRRYATLRPGASLLQPTYVGHVWIVTSDGMPLGGVVAAAGDGRVEVR